MNAFDELINLLKSFTPEQLEQFLNDPVTELILRHEEEPQSCLQEVS